MDASSSASSASSEVLCSGKPAFCFFPLFLESFGTPGQLQLKILKLNYPVGSLGLERPFPFTVFADLRDLALKRPQRPLGAGLFLADEFGFGLQALDGCMRSGRGLSQRRQARIKFRFPAFGCRNFPEETRRLAGCRPGPPVGSHEFPVCLLPGHVLQERLRLPELFTQFPVPCRLARLTRDRLDMPLQLFDDVIDPAQVLAGCIQLGVQLRACAGTARQSPQHLPGCPSGNSAGH